MYIYINKSKKESRTTYCFHVFFIYIVFWGFQLSDLLACLHKNDTISKMLRACLVWGFLFLFLKQCKYVFQKIGLEISFQGTNFCIMCVWLHFLRIFFKELKTKNILFGAKIFTIMPLKAIFRVLKTPQGLFSEYMFWTLYFGNYFIKTLSSKHLPNTRFISGTQHSQVSKEK